MAYDDIQTYEDCITPAEWNAMIVAIAAGGGGRVVVNKAAAYNAVAFEIIIVDTAGGNVTITLPAGPASGDIIDIKNTDVNTVIIAGNGNNIDDAANLSLFNIYESVSLVFDGTDWWII